MAGGVIGWTTLARAGCCRLHAGHRMSGDLSARLRRRPHPVDAGRRRRRNTIGTANKTGPKAGFTCRKRPRAAWHLEVWIRPTPSRSGSASNLRHAVADRRRCVTMPPVRPLIVLPLACWYASTAQTRALRQAVVLRQRDRYLAGSKHRSIALPPCTSSLPRSPTAAMPSSAARRLPY